MGKLFNAFADYHLYEISDDTSKTLSNIRPSVGISCSLFLVNGKVNDTLCTLLVCFIIYLSLVEQILVFTNLS